MGGELQRDWARHNISKNSARCSLITRVPPGSPSHGKLSCFTPTKSRAL